VTPHNLDPQKPKLSNWHTGHPVAPPNALCDIHHQPHFTYSQAIFKEPTEKNKIIVNFVLI
jgi:hypothetical protein